MELAEFKKVKLSDIISFDRFDYFITSPVNENDCFLVCRNPKVADIEKALGTMKPEGCPCRQTGTFDKQLFRRINSGAGKFGEPGRFIESICNGIDRDQINLLIDYSCMPVEWYAGIMDAISRIGSGTRIVNTYMVYLPKRCAPLNNDASTASPLNKRRKNSGKPVSVIVGLDQEPLKISEIEDTLKPRDIVAFLPEISTDPGYGEDIKKSNLSIIQKISSFNLFNYSIDDPEGINSKLASLCLKMRLKSEVVIVPGGPKIFSVIALLLSMQYPDVKLVDIRAKRHLTRLLHAFVKPRNRLLPVAIKATFCEEIDDLEFVPGITG